MPYSHPAHSTDDGELAFLMLDSGRFLIICKKCKMRWEMASVSGDTGTIIVDPKIETIHGNVTGLVVSTVGVEDSEYDPDKDFSVEKVEGDEMAAAAEEYGDLFD